MPDQQDQQDQQQGRRSDQDGMAALTCEKFAGVNTATTRAGVPDEQAYWIDGFMYLAARNLRTLPGIGSSLYTATKGIVTLGAITAGSGGSGGPFTAVPLTGGTGTGAQATITLSGSGVGTVVITAPGSGYTSGDVLSAASGNIGGTTGFSVIVSTIQQIICFYFYNLGANPYVIIFLADGSAVQVNTSTGATITVLPVGTILIPSIKNIGTTQSGSQYLIIVANQANGYWIWDGTLLYSAGTLAPQLTVTSGGSAYISPPVVLFSGGNGTGASAQAQVSGGVVTNVILVDPGSGYLAGDVPVVTLSGGQLGGSHATLTAVMATNTGGSGGSISSTFNAAHGSGGVFLYWNPTTTVVAPGSGYSQYAQATWSFNPATGNFVQNGTIAPVALSLALSGGSITGVSISPPVAGPVNNVYWQTTNSSYFPTITISDDGGAYMSSVTVNAVGSNYSPSTTIEVTGGNVPVTPATLRPVINNGTITSVTILNGGLYTGASPAPTITISDVVASATVTCTIMPYGVQGTAVENYQGHVWVFNGNVFNFTAPGSISDFSTSNGGGSDKSSASYLKVGYTSAISTNGFLFLIGDSSMDYISGVQTTTPSGGSPTTTFTQNNCDPEIGTPYPAAVTTLGQDILVANPTGIFVSSGGAFVKQSEALDGVYNTVPSTQFNANPFNGFQLSAAKATIFGKRVWMALVPIVDPVTQQEVSKLLMFNGKLWWASQQDADLFFIQGQEINSIYTAWGTDGTHLYPLFNQPSAAFTKTLQTKLWDDPGGYESNKADTRFWGVFDYFSTSSPNLTVDIDAIGIDFSGAQFANTQTYTITGPGSTGYFITLPQAIGQQGIFTGMTIQTNSADMVIVSIKTAAGNVQYRG
jgi:hypothetical protein